MGSRILLLRHRASVIPGSSIHGLVIRLTSSSQSTRSLNYSRTTGSNLALITILFDAGLGGAGRAGCNIKGANRLAKTISFTFSPSMDARSSCSFASEVLRVEGRSKSFVSVWIRVTTDSHLSTCLAMSKALL